MAENYTVRGVPYKRFYAQMKLNKMKITNLPPSQATF
jgi:hypothetical protein